MGLLIAMGLQRSLGIKVGWIAMRRNLLAQAKEEITHRRLSVQAAFISMFDKDPPSDLDLLVVDEAQHDAANSMAHLHSVIKPKFILGLSATPFRTDKVKLCFDSVIRDAGIHQLIQERFLSEFHHYTIPSYTPRKVCEFYTQDPGRWGKSIFYFHTLEQCSEAHQLLNRSKIRSDVVTGSSDRESQLMRFQAGELDVLINCMVLAEGFDCPSLATVFCRPSGKAITVQMCGRVFRKHPDLPVKNVVQCQKTRWPFVRTASAAQQFVWAGDSWKTLMVNPQIQQVGLNALKALARSEVKLPEYLDKKISKRQRDWMEHLANRES